VTGQEAIWDVIIAGEQFGPLTTAQIIEHLESGLLDRHDLIWGPGLSGWKTVSEVADLWRPPAPTQREPPPIPIPADSEHVGAPTGNDAPPPGAKWSVWRSANIGLVVSAVVVALQIAKGRGFELADYAHTASAGTISYLIGQILSIPLLFALIATVRNLSKRGRPESKGSAVLGAPTFAVLLGCILSGPWLYGEMYASRTDIMSGEARSNFIAGAHGSCLRKQRSVSQNVSEAQLDKYCACVAQNLADHTTYKQWGGPLDASALADLKQKVEAASAACRS